jgi:hypothetical protein
MDKDSKDITKYSEYRFRNSCDKETTERLISLREKLGAGDLPLNSIGNLLMKIGLTCLEKSIPEMQIDVSKKLKNKFPALMDLFK